MPPKTPASSTKNAPAHPHQQGPHTFSVRSMLERFEKRFEGLQKVPDVVLVLGGTNDVLKNVPWNRNQDGHVLSTFFENATLFELNQIVHV